MMDNKDSVEMTAEEQADLLLRQLLHLKQYETPSVERMTKNKNNIMRRVRDASHTKRWSLGDLLELNIPWFFAEPRYGIALLFLVFAGLQFWGVNAQKEARGSKTGIYTSSPGMAVFEPTSYLASTNSISYPELPRNLKYFPEPGESGVKFAGRLEKKK
jgi:hypothetical protein